MNWEPIEGNWKQLRRKIMSRWTRLTDRDLELIEGKRDQLAGMIQARYGSSQETIERELDEFRQSVVCEWGGLERHSAAT
jgi:uncharacterized protein YjbJ (UPF0337 family)